MVKFLMCIHCRYLRPKLRIVKNFLAKRSIPKYKSSVDARPYLPKVIYQPIFSRELSPYCLSGNFDFEKGIEKDQTLTQTEWMLLARYNGMPVIPVDSVVADFFPSVGKAVFLRKILDGSIKLPVIRMENSQKGAKGIYVTDLARYIDDRHAEAMCDYNRMHC